jgi:AraC-like DNA-binding protein
MFKRDFKTNKLADILSYHTLPSRNWSRLKNHSARKRQTEAAALRIYHSLSSHGFLPSRSFSLPISRELVPSWLFLSHLRLDFAAKLLRDAPSVSVTDVAFACGFSPVSILQHCSGGRPSVRNRARFQLVHLKITMGAPVRRGVGLLMSHLGRSASQGAPVQ